MVQLGHLLALIGDHFWLAKISLKSEQKSEHSNSLIYPYIYRLSIRQGATNVQMKALKVYTCINNSIRAVQVPHCPHPCLPRQIPVHRWPCRPV